MRDAATSGAAAQRAGVAQGHRWFFGVVRPHDRRYDAAQVPSGYLVASAEDMTHFLIAQQNGGRYLHQQLLSPTAVASMQAPGVPTGAPNSHYGLGWEEEPIDGVPTVEHSGDNYYGHGIAFLEPGTRRAAVILVNGNGALPLTAAFRPIEAGVARILADQQPAPPSRMGLRGSYLLLDAVLAVVLLLVMLPLARLRRWGRGLQRNRSEGRRRTLRTVTRGVLEIAIPLAVLGAARLALHVLGAQSWAEGLALLPDTGAWLWVVCLVVLLTGVLRMAVALRVSWRPAAGTLVRPGAQRGRPHVTAR
jgi:CubicO group peptidase (beta-lactamase class C family)